MDQHINLYEVVLRHLRSKRIAQKVVARDSGVPFSTVAKIAQGAVTDPSVHTVQKLYDYFCGQGALAVPDGSPEINPAIHFECASGDPRHGIDRRQPENRQIKRRNEDA